MIIEPQKLNEDVELLCRTDKGFGKKKGGKKTDFSVSSLRVEPERFELSSKQGINKLSTKFRIYLVFDLSQAYIHTKLKLRC